MNRAMKRALLLGFVSGVLSYGVGWALARECETACASHTLGTPDRCECLPGFVGL